MYFLEDPGHSWLVVPLAWARRVARNEISGSSFTSPLRALAYLEEDVDAPLFAERAGVSLDNVPIRYINDFEDYIRRHGLRPYKSRRKVG